MKVIAWVLIIWGCLLQLSLVNVLRDIAKGWPVPQNIEAILSPIVSGIILLLVGIRLKQKYNK